jgi:predicted ArsR family transcriptional regulator
VPAPHVPHDRPPLDDELAVIGALQEPVRRALYRYVASQAGDVGRDEAAAAVGIQRSLAAFHLDKLVEAGLLEATYRRLTGRSGPGAGRPAKLYRRSRSEHAVSLPPRHYDLAAELLAEAVEDAGGGGRPIRQAVGEVAHRFGRRVGEEVEAGLGARASRERRLSALADTLGRFGYEPRREGRALLLANCPFHTLAERHRELVCGMNLSLLDGVVEAMGGGNLEAQQDRQPGACCVTVSVKGRRT